ncbi:sugar ABC transporter permease [Fusibacter sp. 3D3]|uniref:ABC transporter permease n=1 Tax=Fusibacter sp. 3D3 TaxID=1048380 RepID=UPI0008536E81|nr:ABC transporter permease subunit [Fusibacter sp. 3D3]GAU75747.1 xylose ABC transporter [Fusibacter sp. 3D3]
MDFRVNQNSKLKRFLETLRRDWALYVLLIPIIVFFVMWRYKPMGGVLVAFKKYKVIDGVLGSDFAGFYYIRELMFGSASREFWRALRNTFMLNIYGILFGFPAPIILALLFSEIKNVAYRSVTQTFSYLPKFISEVIITTLIAMLVSNSHGQVGIVAHLLQMIGVIGPDAKLLYEPGYFRAIYIVSDIWVGAGYGSIVYFAAIMGIPPSNYEAARVDGASKFDQIRYITMPGMASTLTIMLILRIGSMLAVGFEKVFLLYNASIYETADVLETFIYRLGMGETAVNPSIATAAGLFNSLVAMVLVLGANYISRKISETSLF